jgi:uncharacterized cupredoxin-like copper-binding protein
MFNLHRWLRVLSALMLSLAIALGTVAIEGAMALPPQRGIAAPLAPSKQSAREIKVELGSAAGDLKFFPADLAFVPGKRYKLILNNPSPVKHYFTAKDFAGAIWTQKVDAGNVEIKGAINELELRPGTQAEWVFVTIRPGTYSLRCVIPGHTEAGMVGTIKIA